MKRLLILLGVAAALSTTTTSFIPRQEDPWKVPEKYKKLKNPVVPDEASVKFGGELYESYCSSCHGMNGKGAGRRSDKLDAKPTDFTSDAFQQQSDGELLYKIYFGHKDMPGFKKKIPGNEDVIGGTFGKTRVPGDLINYIRTYAKKSQH
ncbi:MAG: c-type cytochrome [Bacteroidota bacterium]|nr:c-type cytochrome [Bacteroidota bacterium]